NHLSDHLRVFDISSGRTLFDRDGCAPVSPDGARMLANEGTHLDILDASTGMLVRRIETVAADRARFTSDGRFVTWIDGVARGDQKASQDVIRALRIADGAMLWLALLDGPDGPRLVARREAGDYDGDARCLPPPTEMPRNRPALIAEF